MVNWHPELLPIQREEDYHTHYLGETQSGRLFFGYETFVFPDGYVGDNWQEHRLEYAVLYVFDKDGTYVETQYKCAGKTADIHTDTVTHLLEELLETLGEYEFKDIRVQPFKIEIDGMEFGLVPNEDIKMIELQPSSTIAFTEPWDGEYYT